MPTLDILIIIVISIMVVSVILSVVDWIYLASLASKTTFLEREVEKKSLEFDGLKKERYNAQHPSMGSASVIESTEPLVNNASPPAITNEETIQIVRNVRGNFERTEHFTNNSHEYPQEQMAVDPLPPPPDTVHEYSQDVLYSETTQHPVLVKQSAGSEGIPLPSVTTSENHLPQTTAAAGGSTNLSTAHYPSDDIVLKLYSDSTRDADFQILWKTITDTFQTRQDPHIIIDMASINFMYDKEMDYLEKINYLLTGQGGLLTFINCDRELLTLFNNRPRLRSIVNQKAV